MDGFIRPQLAETHPRGVSLNTYDPLVWYAEQKWDGIRLGIRVEDGIARAWSRLGNIKTLSGGIATDCALLPNGYYDGELIVVGGKSWHVTTGANFNNLRLVLFDVLEILGTDITHLPQSERNTYLEVAVSNIKLRGVNVDLPARRGPSEEFYDEVRKSEGEGIMVKRNDAPYRPGMRSQAWLKVKAIIEVELPCIGFEEGTTKGLLSVAQLRLPNGRQTTVKSRTMRDAEQWTKDPSAFIGLSMEVEAQCWTDDGALRHPRMVRWAGPHE